MNLPSSFFHHLMKGLWVVIMVVHNYDDAQCLEYVGLSFFSFEFANFVSFIDELCVVFFILEL
jgi:hypothetical protein